MIIPVNKKLMRDCSRKVIVLKALMCCQFVVDCARLINPIEPYIAWMSM